MSNIITISREFGSGGRELGKRLACFLGYDYYDRELLLLLQTARCSIKELTPTVADFAARWFGRS